MIECDRILAGGLNDFMQVRHLVLKGPMQDIGRDLATIARTHHQCDVTLSRDPKLSRARREWFERHWPAQAERMRGAATAYGVAYDNDGLDLGTIPYLMSLGACSAVWYPPRWTSDGHGRLSRNYDFSTGSLADFLAFLSSFLPQSPQFAPPPPVPSNQLPMTARPYLIETYPDRGYSTLIVKAYDMLSGCIDGVNSAGLTIALLADKDASPPPVGTGVNVGLNELELGHFLLETCGSVADVLEAVDRVEHYAPTAPCHYIIGDRSGASVVWEPFAQGRPKIVAGSDAIQILTNHQLTRFPTVADLPPVAGEGDTYERMRILACRLAVNAVFDPQDIAAAAATVRLPAAPESPIRTLWYSQYDVQDASLDIVFYLGDKAGGALYSGPIHLALDQSQKRD
jgi:predicted choloylglycine hydrolase